MTHQRISRDVAFGSLVAVSRVPQTEMAMTLVRHGESDWNELDLVQGQNDTARLSPRGIAQACAVAPSFRDLGFEHLVTSDLARARETADLIGRAVGLAPESDPLLRERCFGELEGGPLATLTSGVTGIVNGVLVDPDARAPGGETFRDVVARAERFLEQAEVKWPGERLLVVTHGGTIRALRAVSSGAALVGLAWYSVPNCSVWALAMSDAH